MWKIGLEGSRQTSADKTTPKLVTEQLRASQKVLNKSDQFIPVVPVARGGAGAHGPTLRAPPMRREGGAGSQWESRMRRHSVLRPTGHPAAPNPLLGSKFKPWCRVRMFFSKQERPTTLCDTLSKGVWAHFYWDRIQPNNLEIILLCRRR